MVLKRSPSDLQLHRHRLDNGLRVVVQPDASLPLVAVNLWYHVGSKNERPGRTGLAHLFEHMLFQGSQNVAANDHFRFVQQAGGVLNGSTWYDRTNYYETLPSHQLRLGLWLESDRMGYLLPALTPEKLENQREVVMNERRQRVDNQPYGRAMERLHELLYPEGHPYRWPVIGYMDDIAAATLEDVESFFRTFYAPNNAVLSLVGDLDPERACEEAEAWFGTIPAGPPVPRVELLAPEPDGERRETLDDDVNLARLYLGWSLAGYGEPDWYAADLLARVLTGGRSSPLYHDLVYRRQIARDVSSYVFPTELGATFLVVATARPGTDVDDLLEILDEHLWRTATEELPEEDLERARNRLLTGWYSDLQTVGHRADLISQMTTFFDAPERVAGEADRYRTLGGAELMGVARRTLSTDRRAVVTVLPRRRP